MSEKNVWVWFWVAKTGAKTRHRCATYRGNSTSLQSWRERFSQTETMKRRIPSVSVILEFLSKKSIVRLQIEIQCAREWSIALNLPPDNVLVHPGTAVFGCSTIKPTTIFVFVFVDYNQSKYSSLFLFEPHRTETKYTKSFQWCVAVFVV